MKWPWAREERAVDWTAAVLSEASQSLSSGDYRSRCAALDACASYWERSAAAVVSTGSRASAVSPQWLSAVVGDLIRRGQSISSIETSPLSLRRASSWDASGSSWNVDTAAPDGGTAKRLPDAGVINLIWRSSQERPWEGIGPVAPSLSKLCAALEMRLGDEVSGAVGQVFAVPPVGDALLSLKETLSRQAGGPFLVETTQVGWGNSAAKPQRDWQSERLGANPPGPLVQLYDSVCQALYAACGISPLLLMGGGDGTAMREAYRQFLHCSLSPVLRIVEHELRVKLDDASISLDASPLSASDTQGRGRAVQSLVASGMELSKALDAAGLGERS